MKKTLVALAALSATAVFAQSSFSITGYIDRGYQTVNNSLNAGTTKAFSSNAGTTRFEFQGKEDLGGGMAAGFFVETDWNPIGGTTNVAGTTTTGISGTTGTTALAGNVANQNGVFANSESYIKLDTANGTVKLGTVNNEMLPAVTAVGSPAFSTGTGGVYSTNFSIFNGVGTGTSGTGSNPVWVANSATQAGARSIRQDNTIKYESPVFAGGFQVKLGYAPKNDVALNSSATTGATGGITMGATDLAIKYTNGPVDLIYTSVKYDFGADLSTTRTSTTFPTAVAGLVNSTQTNTFYGGNYAVMPTLKLFAAFGSSKSADSLTVNTASSQFGAQYAMGNIDFLAIKASVNDKTTSDFDRTLTGLGANYNLSKTTRLYYRYDNISYNSNAASGVTTTQKRNAAGISMLF